MEKHDVIVVGGGAAGFFGAIRFAELCKIDGQNADVTLIERSDKLLSKVLVSGGGRCNVTHSCFDPQQLAGYYPRGGNALRGAFTKFQPRDTIKWFKEKGVELKTEKDGRMFPVTNRSTTIADCLLQTAEKLGVKVRTKVSLRSLTRNDNDEYPWQLQIVVSNSNETEVICAKGLLIATGGTPQMHQLLQENGITITPTAPSLFTFMINDDRIKGIPGLSVENTSVVFFEPNREHPVPSQTGPILVTHWGLSGPAILRLSAWGAKRLAENSYKDRIRINWLHPNNADDVFDVFQKIRNDPVYGRKTVLANSAYSQIPSRMWRSFISSLNISETKKWADMNNRDLRSLAELLVGMELTISGKGVYKDEFVTAGGVDLDKVNFKDMQSREAKGVFFAGEILDVDGVTGGFNFQNAWTTAWIAGGGLHQALFGVG